jgi:Leucine-rich repeat (LRR) protein
MTETPERETGVCPSVSRKSRRFSWKLPIYILLAVLMLLGLGWIVLSRLPRGPATEIIIAGGTIGCRMPDSSGEVYLSSLRNPDAWDWLMCRDVYADLYPNVVNIAWAPGPRDDLGGIERFANLEKVNLGGNYVGDDAIACCVSLKKLRYLCLAGTQVTDAGLAGLRELPNLEDLVLSQTRITGRGLAWLEERPNLESLSLDDTQVDDASLAHLKNLEKLTFLELSGTGTTDAGLVHLKGLKSVRILSLNDTQVTDAGILVLTGLGQLQHLNVHNTKVTRKGAQAFQALAPKCSVSYGPLERWPTQSSNVYWE